MQPERIAGLDGLRGIAVALVVAFHLWPDHVPGGFVGVSVFFALSGFLITRQVLSDPSFCVTAFYGRRLRRLMPLALVTLVLIALVWRGLGWLDASTGRDVRWALGNAANWQRIVDGSQYGAGVIASPVDHYWSLSIEEQFYLVFPLLVLMGRTRRRLTVIAALGFLGVIAALLLADGDPSVVYFSSLIRCGEILAGVLAALVWRRGEHRRTPGGVVPLHYVMSVLCLGALIYLARFTSLDSVGYYHGGLLAVGGGSAVLVWSLSRGGLVARCVDNRVMRWAGSRSYALYLFHWPLIVGFRRALGGWRVPAFALVLTVVLAEVSYRVIEAPIRRRVVAQRYLVAMCLALVVGVVAGTAGLVSTKVDFAQAQRAFDATLSMSTSSMGLSTGVTTVTPQRQPAASEPIQLGEQAAPRRIVLVGDSKALVLALAKSYLSRSVVVGSFVHMGCPLGRTGRVRASAREGRGYRVDDRACDWTAPLPYRVAALAPVDAVVVYFGTWDAAERLVPALGGQWTTADDPAYVAWLVSEIDQLVGLVEAAGARRVVFATTPPTLDPVRARRIALFNGMLKQMEQNSGRIGVVDLAKWLQHQPDKDRLSPDLSHFGYLPDGGTAREVYERFLDGALAAVMTVERTFRRGTLETPGLR